MKNSMIINEMRKLDILIGKKMFDLAKVEKMNTPPSPLQFKILEFLLKNQDNDYCPKDFENKFNVSKATISGVLVTMEKRGIITMVASSKDARCKIVKLTNKSIDQFNEMNNILNKMNDELVKGISEYDLNTFFNVLQSMKNNLSNLNLKEG